MSEFEGFGITELEVGQTAEITRLVDENTVRQFAEVRWRGRASRP